MMVKVVENAREGTTKKGRADDKDSLVWLIHVA